MISKWSRTRIAWSAAVLLGLIVAAAAVLVAGASSPGPSPSRASVGPAVQGQPAALPSVGPDSTPASSPSASTGLPSNAAAVPAAGDRIRISKIGIDAPLNTKIVPGDGQMQRPDNPDEVVWYDFSQWPGLGGAPGAPGNAVFSGEVDSGRNPCDYGRTPPPCRAVLWDLSRLEKGDEIVVVVGGRTLLYTVDSNRQVDATTGPWNEIVAATSDQSITLITCAGNFDSTSRQYDMRQVVTAKRAG